MMRLKKTKTLPLLIALICAFSYSQSAISKTCSGLLSNKTEQLTLAEFSNGIYDFTDLYKGIKLLNTAISRGHSNLTVNEIARDLPTSDGELPPTGLNLRRGQLSVNRLSPYINWGQYSSASFTQKLYAEDEVPDLFISVHAMQSTPVDYLTSPFSLLWHKERHNFTNRILEDMLQHDEFQNIPRIMLASKEFKIRSSAYLSHASAVYYSIAGEIVGPLPLAANYHIVGEQFRACVSRTVHQLIDLVLNKSTNAFSNLYLYSDHMLDVNGDGISLDSVTELFPLSRSIDQYGKESLIRGHLLPSFISWSPQNGFRNKDHFKLNYFEYEEFIEVENLITGSKVRIHIL